VVEEGFVRFADLMMTPRFVEEASRLAITARGLGTAPTTRSELTVDARLTGGARLELRGVTAPSAARSSRTSRASSPASR
jgi:hypothetical protein